MTTTITDIFGHAHEVPGPYTAVHEIMGANTAAGRAVRRV